MFNRYSQWILVLYLVYLTSSIRPIHGGGGGGGSGRNLLGFRETLGNSTFQCSASGPCVRCQYSEKNDDTYHCSETGYRVPLKCIEIKESSKEETDGKTQRRRLSSKPEDGFNSYSSKMSDMSSSTTNLKWRRLSDSSLKPESSKSYVTYRSCVPVESDEKLSVLGFEMIMVALLLVSGPVAYYRQKRAVTMAPGIALTRMPNRL